MCLIDISIDHLYYIRFVLWFSDFLSFIRSFLVLPWPLFFSLLFSHLAFKHRVLFSFSSTANTYSSYLIHFLIFSLSHHINLLCKYNQPPHLAFNSLSSSSFYNITYNTYHHSHFFISNRSHLNLNCALQSLCTHKHCLRMSHWEETCSIPKQDSSLRFYRLSLTSTSICREFNSLSAQSKKSII